MTNSPMKQTNLRLKKRNKHILSKNDNLLWDIRLDIVKKK